MFWHPLYLLFALLVVFLERNLVLVVFQGLLLLMGLDAVKLLVLYIGDLTIPGGFDNGVRQRGEIVFRLVEQLLAAC